MIGVRFLARPLVAESATPAIVSAPRRRLVQTVLHHDCASDGNPRTGLLLPSKRVSLAFLTTAAARVALASLEVRR